MDAALVRSPLLTAAVTETGGEKASLNGRNQHPQNLGNYIRYIGCTAEKSNKYSNKPDMPRPKPQNYEKKKKHSLHSQSK